FVRAMHNERAFSNIQMSIAVGVTYLYGPEFERILLRMSSVVHWWPRIEVGWLKPDEVKKMSKKVSTVKCDEKKIFEVLQGQPYLTHAAIMYPKFCEALLSWSNGDTEQTSYEVLISDAFRR